MRSKHGIKAIICLLTLVVVLQINIVFSRSSTRCETKILPENVATSAVVQNSIPQLQPGAEELHQKIPAEAAHEEITELKEKHDSVLEQPVHSGSETCEHGDLVRIKTRPNFLICVYPRSEKDLISRSLMDKGVWPECVAFYRSAQRLLNNPHMTIVDVGANIGSCTMFFAASGAKVISFEPLSTNYELLQSSLKLNPNLNVELHKSAAASKDGHSTIYTETTNHGNSIIVDEGASGSSLPRSRGSGSWKKYEVSMTTLDEHVHEHVHMMKMDCQGYEFDALQGATRLLEQQSIDCIIFELDVALLRLRKVSPSDIFAFLMKYGYTIKTPTGDRLRSIHSGVRGGNFIAFRKEFTHWSDGKSLYPS